MQLHEPRDQVEAREQVSNKARIPASSRSTFIFNSIVTVEVDCDCEWNESKIRRFTVMWIDDRRC